MCHRDGKLLPQRESKGLLSSRLKSNKGRGLQEPRQHGACASAPLLGPAENPLVIQEFRMEQVTRAEHLNSPRPWWQEGRAALPLQEVWDLACLSSKKRALSGGAAGCGG